MNHYCIAFKYHVSGISDTTYLDPSKKKTRTGTNQDTKHLRDTEIKSPTKQMVKIKIKKVQTKDSK